MQCLKSPVSSKAVLKWSAVFWMSLLSALGAQAQSGFIIPGIRADGGSDFAYWDFFDRMPGSTINRNYNYDNPPALGGGFDDDENPTTTWEDHDSNPATPLIPRATLSQTGAPNAFVTSTGSIYSFDEDEISKFEVPYRVAANEAGEVTNVIFQTQTGGSRLNVNTVHLIYEENGLPVTVFPIFKGLDDRQTGSFFERIVCAFQWDLTGKNVRNFRVVVSAPGPSMPLWEAQLDVVVADPFEQELGYLMATRARPLTRHGRPGRIDKNLPPGVDERYFIQGQSLTLLGEPELVPGNLNKTWLMSGWSYQGTTQAGNSLPLIFPAEDITVTALFAPNSYATWRDFMFYHFNSLIGTQDDYLNDAISAPLVDHDGDGLINAGEYAFGGDPYNDEDDARTRPQLRLVEVEGVTYPALRYRTNGVQQTQLSDVVQKVRVAANDGPFQENTTVLFDRQLQTDGTELITHRSTTPLAGFTSVKMDVIWSVGSLTGQTLAPAPLAITTSAPLVGGHVGTAYSLQLAASGGMEPYVSWTKTQGDLPPGLSLGTNGILQGIPTTVGSYTFTVKVTDSFMAEVTKELTLTIQPFEITTTSPLAVHRLGTPVNVALASSGGTGPYAWSFTGTLPAGVELTAAGVLTGTPTQAGVYSFAVEVEDAGEFKVTKAFEWTVIDLQILTANPLPLAVKTFPYAVTLTASGGEAPFTWTRTAGTLPTGLTLSAGGVISGTPTGSGLVSFTVQVSDGDSFTTTKVFNLTVSETVPAPVVNPVVFGSKVVGEEFSHTVTAQNYPSKFTVTGLPKGMKVVVANGTAVLSGRASLAGVYLVQIRASNTGGNSPIVTAPLVIKALPVAQVGTFTGLISRDATANSGLGSLFTLTTTSTGAYTLQVKAGAVSKSAKGFLNGSAPQVQISINGADLALSLNAQTHLVTGTHGAATASGWRLVWDKKFNPPSSLEGYYSTALELSDEEDLEDVTLPQGIGYTTFTVAPAGTVKLTGKSADGQTITASTNLGPNGELAIYAPVYANKGTLLGQWAVEEDEEGLFIGNKVTGELTWSKPVTTGRTYPAAFGPVDLAVEGGYLGATATGVVMGLPEMEATIGMSFEGAGIESSATVANVTGAKWTEGYAVDFAGATNAGKVTLKVSKASGSLSGTFTLADTEPVKLDRKGVKFTGQVVRLSDGTVKAVGHYLLAQKPANATEKPTATPILSGAFLLTLPTVVAP